MTARRGLLRPAVTLPALAAAGAGAPLVGLRLGVPWLLPLFEAAPAWAVMIALLLRGRRAAAVAHMLWWAAWLGASMTVLCAADPWGTASTTVLHGTVYFGEMRSWVETGRGCESDPACFVPQHLLHAAAFSLLCLATASAAGIVMGAFLMNYMAFYVGSLAAPSVAPLSVALLGWHPWSLVRVASFVILGAVLAEPLAGRIAGRAPPPGRGPWAAAAAAGLILDVLIKAALAPGWAPLLRKAVHG